MATKKKPTAAQLRAREAFTKVMKSGGFGKARKKATRKRNPIVAGPVKIVRTSPVGRLAGRKKNPVKKTVAKRTIRRIARKTNPTHAPVAYAVHRTKDGVKGALIAKFMHKADAVQYARAYAKAKNCQVGITGKAH